MDGHFVPNITFGPAVVAALRPHTRLPLDVHLMIAPVDPYIDAFAEAGADIITVHAEAGPHLHRSLQAIRALGKKAGVSLNPATHESALQYVLDDIDLVLVMSVNPGFGGQSFIPGAARQDPRHSRDDRAARHPPRGRWRRHAARRRRAIVDAGADVLVAGSAAFRGGASPYEAISPRCAPRRRRRARSRSDAFQLGALLL